MPAEAIRSLHRGVLFVEIHDDVLKRIGTSDIEMLAQIATIRRFSWVNADDGESVDTMRPILAQLGQRQCDLIGVSEVN